MEPKLTKHVRAWLDNLDLPYIVDYFGGGFYGVTIDLNDNRHIILTDEFGETVPSSLNSPIMCTLTNEDNEFWVSVFSKRLKDFHIHQCF